MSRRKKNKTEYFSRRDHLRWLQLSARKAVHERKNSKTKNVKESEANEPTLPIPEKWRLVPEGVNLYKWQQECIDAWYKNGYRGTVKVATGGGKTLFALAAAQHIQNNRESQLCLAIVVPTIVLLNQWYEELESSNLPMEVIAKLGGGNSVSDVDLSAARVLICVLVSAQKHLPNLIKLADWEQKMLLIVDECHKAGANQAKNIFQIDPAFTLGLSATPERNDESDNYFDDYGFNDSTLGKALGPIIFDYTIDQCFEDGLLAPFEVHHIGLPLTKDESEKYRLLSNEISNFNKSLRPLFEQSKQNHFMAWCRWVVNQNKPYSHKAAQFINLTSERKRLLYQAKFRFEIAIAILSDFSKSSTDGKAILFHETIQEVEALFDRASRQGLPAVLEHSNLPQSLRNDSIEAFRNGTARIIFSAKSLIEGFNVPSADLGLICASTSSVRQRIQSLGRMLRRKPNNEEATIYALYVNDTVDVEIYKKADWENIVGAKRNRYFTWSPTIEGESWRKGLEEDEKPPIEFKPLSEGVEVGNLKPGDEYPGRDDGHSLKVDRMKNLRTRNGGLIVRAEREIIDQVIKLIDDRNLCHLTEAGHLIVRKPAADSSYQVRKWEFVADLDVKITEEPTGTIKLLKKRTSGKWKILKKEKENIVFASGPEESIKVLLDWIARIEAGLSIEADEIYWDEKSKYWMEIYSKRHVCPESEIKPLEF